MLGLGKLSTNVLKYLGFHIAHRSSFLSHFDSNKVTLSIYQARTQWEGLQGVSPPKISSLQNTNSEKGP